MSGGYVWRKTEMAEPGVSELTSRRNMSGLLSGGKNEILYRGQRKR